MEFLRKDLTYLRLTKILNSVVHNVSIDEGVLTWGERLLIMNLKKSIKTLGIENPNILDTQDNLPITNLQDDSGVETGQIEENSDVILASPANLMIRLLDDVETFIGLDDKRYGPLKKYDIVYLPTANAKALITRGVARVIETSAIIREKVVISGEKL